MPHNLSPFARALGASAPQLPRLFADQFLATETAGYDILIKGTMSRVWHRPRWVALPLWLLARFNMLFPETGQNVPTQVRIRYGTVDGKAVQVWTRRFYFPRRRAFDATVEYNEHLGSAVERFAPAGCLELAWSVSFLPPDQLHIDANSWRFRAGPLAIKFPGFLVGGVVGRQYLDPEVEDGIRVSLRVSNPVFGDFFGYEGRFVVIKRPRK